MEEEFINYCKNGSLAAVQEFKKRNSNVNISFENYYFAFRYACLNGHLHVAKWLLSIKPTINISALNEEVFRWSCSNGQLHVAQWLLSVKPDIVISYFNECAFRWACNNNQLHVAQWLLSVKPDINISVWNENAFRMACHYEDLRVAVWLLFIKPSIDFREQNLKTKKNFGISFLLYCFHQKNINLFLL
jgi:ankyrin repeat protein